MSPCVVVAWSVRELGVLLCIGHEAHACMHACVGATTSVAGWGSGSGVIVLTGSRCCTRSPGQTLIPEVHGFA